LPSAQYPSCKSSPGAGDHSIPACSSTAGALSSIHTLPYSKEGFWQVFFLNPGRGCHPAQPGPDPTSPSGCWGAPELSPPHLPCRSAVPRELGTPQLAEI